MVSARLLVSWLSLVSFAEANSALGNILFGSEGLMGSTEIFVFICQFVILAVVILAVQALSGKDKQDKAKLMASELAQEIQKNNPLQSPWFLAAGNQTVLASLFTLSVCASILIAPFIFERGTVKHIDKLIVLSVAADTFGLIILRHRIQQSASVVGISGQSVCMFTITKFYVAMDCPHARLADLGLWGVKVLDWVSLVLILDVARCVFAKYRATYQEDTDILKAKWIVVCNAIAAIAYQPAPYELQKAFELYLDTFSALPQVAMMVRQSDNVEAPIAHFLAATSMSRITDFFEWCNRFHFWDHPLHMQFSHIVILFCHAAYVLTVLDFLYLYSKTYFNHSLTTDVILDEHLV